MNASDWIAVASAGIATLAFVVGGRALQLQRAGAEGGAQQQFDQLVHQLGIAQGKMTGYGTNPVSTSTGPPPNYGAVLAEIQTLALQAHDLLHSQSQSDTPVGWYRRLLHLWNPPGRPPQLNWFDAVVLAFSFAQVWDTERARSYWESAEALVTSDAKIGPSAEIYTQRSIGSFYYNTNGDTDLQSARAAFDRAANVLKPEVNGADLTHDQNYETRFLQAQQEEQLGNTDQAANFLREAWHSSTQVSALWRRQRAKEQTAALVAYGGDPSRFEAYGGLPKELDDEAARLRAQRQAPDAQQQMLAVAWQQGFTAAQQQMFAAQHSLVPPVAPDVRLPPAFEPSQQNPTPPESHSVPAPPPYLY